jgi:hypothetical protein
VKTSLNIAYIGDQGLIQAGLQKTFERVLKTKKCCMTMVAGCDLIVLANGATIPLFAKP